MGLKRFLVPVGFGAAGVAILVALGVWQVQRLAWKEGVLADIEARIAADPVALPAAPDPVEDRYLPVAVEGRFAPDRLDAMASQRIIGAGFRVIQPFETDGGRTILVDRGFVVDEAQDDVSAPAGPVRLVGNLHWPDETDAFTPAPDWDRGLIFARDVGVLAERLGTEPLLLVQREPLPGDAPVAALPVGTEGIPNDHLEYAITWFALAVLWAGMTGYLVWRMARGQEG